MDYEAYNKSIEGRQFVRIHSDIEIEITDPQRVIAAELLVIRSEDGELLDVEIDNAAEAANRLIAGMVIEAVNAIEGLQYVGGVSEPGYVQDGAWHARSPQIAVPARNNDGSFNDQP